MASSQQQLNEPKYTKFLSKFSQSNLVFVVGADSQAVHAVFEVVSTASRTLERLCTSAINSRQVRETRTSDVTAFCMLMHLLHPRDGVMERVDDVSVALRVLPLLKLYSLRARLEECEELLLKKDRSPTDLTLAREHGFKSDKPSKPLILCM